MVRGYTLSVIKKVFIPMLKLFELSVTIVKIKDRLENEHR